MSNVYECSFKDYDSCNIINPVMRNRMRINRINPLEYLSMCWRSFFGLEPEKEVDNHSARISKKHRWLPGNGGSVFWFRVIRPIRSRRADTVFLTGCLNRHWQPDWLHEKTSVKKLTISTLHIQNVLVVVMDAKKSKPFKHYSSDLLAAAEKKYYF